jgi:hypothetical protein
VVNQNFKELKYYSATIGVADFLLPVSEGSTLQDCYITRQGERFALW